MGAANMVGGGLNMVGGGLNKGAAGGVGTRGSPSFLHYFCPNFPARSARHYAIFSRYTNLPTLHPSDSLYAYLCQRPRPRFVPRPSGCAGCTIDLPSAVAPFLKHLGLYHGKLRCACDASDPRSSPRHAAVS